jgi:hypothetical protein
MRITLKIASKTNSRRVRGGIRRNAAAAALSIKQKRPAPSPPISVVIMTAGKCDHDRGKRKRGKTWGGQADAQRWRTSVGK